MRILCEVVECDGLALSSEIEMRTQIDPAPLTRNPCIVQVPVIYGLPEFWQGDRKLDLGIVQEVTVKFKVHEWAMVEITTAAQESPAALEGRTVDGEVVSAGPGLAPLGE